MNNTDRVQGEKAVCWPVLRADNNAQLDAIAFNQEDLSDLTGLQVKLAYRLDANEFRGMRNLQLVVEHLERV